MRQNDGTRMYTRLASYRDPRMVELQVDRPPPREVDDGAGLAGVRCEMARRLNLVQIRIRSLLGGSTVAIHGASTEGIRLNLGAPSSNYRTGVMIHLSRPATATRLYLIVVVQSQLRVPNGDGAGGRGGGGCAIDDGRWKMIHRLVMASPKTPPLTTKQLPSGPYLTYGTRYMRASKPPSTLATHYHEADAENRLIHHYHGSQTFPKSPRLSAPPAGDDSGSSPVTINLLLGLPEYDPSTLQHLHSLAVPRWRCNQANLRSPTKDGSTSEYLVEHVSNVPALPEVDQFSGSLLKKGKITRLEVSRVCVHSLLAANVSQRGQLNPVSTKPSLDPWPPVPIQLSRALLYPLGIGNPLGDGVGDAGGFAE
ncbi:hypothetical protein G7046_g9386 [Stylonectria norvegica]|nr:hypothetical protein G7046_g9386 [Stylonectria norvegica]